MHLSADLNQWRQQIQSEGNTDVNELMHIFDVDLVATNAANKVHEAQLQGVNTNQTGEVQLPNRGNDAVISEFFSFRERAHTQEHLEEQVYGVEEA